MYYKRLLENIIFPFLLFVIILTVSSFLLNISLGQNTTEIDKWSKVISISAPIAGFISVIYTLIVAREAQDKQVSQSSLNLFQLFTDERFRNIRNKAWAVKTNSIQRMGIEKTY
ncbi:hypothetical protein GCM10028817_22290 [Spirosoma pomorum]